MIFYEDIETQSANWAVLRRGCREGGWNRRRLWHEGGTKATNAGGRELITVDLVAVHSSLVTNSRPGYLLCSTSFYWLSLLVLNVAVLEWLLPHVNLLARHWSELWKLGNSQSFLAFSLSNKSSEIAVLISQVSRSEGLSKLREQSDSACRD